MPIEANWPFEQVRPSENEAVYDLLRAFEVQLDRVDVQADELEEQRFIDTATTRELEKLAAEVGIVRETGESDSRLRFRTRIAKAVTRSQGTLEDFEQLLEVIFGDDADTITVSSPNDEPVVQLNIPSAVVDDTSLTRVELERRLADVIPTSDDLLIITDDTFTLGQSGNKGLGNGQLI